MPSTTCQPIWLTSTVIGPTSVLDGLLCHLVHLPYGVLGLRGRVLLSNTSWSIRPCCENEE